MFTQFSQWLTQLFRPMPAQTLDNCADIYELESRMRSQEKQHTSSIFSI